MTTRNLFFLLWIAGGVLPACQREPSGDKGDTQDTSEESGDSEDSTETGRLDTDETGALPVDIDEVARLTVYVDKSYYDFGYSFVLGDITGDGGDDLCFSGQKEDMPVQCFGFRSPIPEGVVEAEEADFAVELDDGQYFAAPGDLNADGIDDLATGNKVFLGPIDDFEPLAGADITLLYDDYYEPKSWQDNQGDSNGDGVDDLILMLQWWNEDPNWGTYDLYVYSGLYSSTIDADAYLTRIINDEGHWELGFMGDTNGDGYDDIGYGRRSLALGPMPSVVGTPDTEFLEAGEGLHALGDVNGDGYDDVAFEGRIMGTKHVGVQVNLGPFAEEVEGVDGVAGMFWEDWEWSDGDYVRNIASTGDQNGDSLPDLVFITGDTSPDSQAVYLWETPLEGLHTTRHATLAMESSASTLWLSDLDGPADLMGDGSSNDFLVGDYHSLVGWVLIGGTLY